MHCRRLLVNAASVLTLITLGNVATAQEYRLETVTVTASRIDHTPRPGVFLRRQGDFMLMDVIVESDSREAALREQEIRNTVDDLLAKAASDPGIPVSVDAFGLIYPLRASVDLPIAPGRRPDTSLTRLVLRTPIPDEVDNAFELASRLSRFAETVDEDGRASLDYDEETTISVVDPHQYRQDLMALIIAEITSVTRALGEDYRVVVTGLDRELSWGPSDSLNLRFYIPYTYEILPTSLTSRTDVQIPDY